MKKQHLHLPTDRLGLGSLLMVAALVLLSAGCEGFFGKKLDPSFIDVPVYNDKQVAYVPIQPVWDGFMHPVDVAIGYDELIYVADDVAEEIVCFDQSGVELGRMSVPGVHVIAMDRSLDLVALGTFDTLGTTLQAIYRIQMDNPDGYGLAHAQIQNKLLHPFYYKNSFAPNVDDQVKLNGLAFKADNSYFVTRSGNATSPVYGPDNAVVRFTSADDFESTVSVNTSLGILNDYFEFPVGITTKAQPPQSPFVNTEFDFVFSSMSSNTQLKVQYINVIATEGGTDYLVEQFPTGDTAKAEGFLYTPNRFAAPVDVAYSGDGTNYIFVVDREKDSLYQFTNTGLEGVKAPAGSTSTKNIKVSFGGTGLGLTQFNEPSAVAYYDQIVYVADAGNRRVLRFKLTTDFD
ncbi:MAG: hypothetical protein U0176_17715 [Bacteroidia bacterium]